MRKNDVEVRGKVRGKVANEMLRVISAHWKASNRIHREVNSSEKKKIQELLAEHGVKKIRAVSKGGYVGFQITFGDGSTLSLRSQHRSYGVGAKFEGPNLQSWKQARELKLSQLEQRRSKIFKALYDLERTHPKVLHRLQDQILPMFWP